MTALDALPSVCWEGAIPSGLGTCSADGMPHFTWLSQVFKLDASHVAVSCQFFKQTKANLAAQPRAQVWIIDPQTGRQWRLELSYEGSVTEGPLFDRMSHRIMMIASQSEASHAFALRSAEIFKVLAVAPVPVQRAELPAHARPQRDELAGLARFAEAVAAAHDLGATVEAGLGVLARELGYERIALYVHDDDALVALGSRGYAVSGIGATVPLGVGVVGACAQHRQPIRVAEVHRELRYERAVIEQLARVRAADERSIPLPGFAGARSMLAVPMLVQGKLVGVLATESQLAYAFDERDERALITAGQMFAQAIRAYDDEEEAIVAAPAPVAAGATVRVRYYDADDSVFVDDDYLVKGLPGRILFLLLTMYQREGRDSFQNKELRLHPFLKLPAYKDNLEARLLVLQRRLEEKRLPLQLDRGERGKLRVVCASEIALEKIS